MSIPLRPPAGGLRGIRLLLKMSYILGIYSSCLDISRDYKLEIFKLLSRANLYKEQGARYKFLFLFTDYSLLVSII